MYPNLYYFCKELFGIEIHALSAINTAGFFVALAFIPAAWLWKKCMIEKERQGVLLPTTITIHKPTAQPVTLKEFPHETTGRVILIAAIAGVIGSKISGVLESPGFFFRDPLATLLSPAGFSFYGGLILASIVIWFYYQRRNIRPLIMADCMSPSFMIAYAVGRLGCHFSGDGDWGISNLHAKPFGWLPDWLWAYRYPHNVLRQSVYIPGCNWEDYCYQLGAPVYPTAVYEVIICTILCVVCYVLRNRFKYAGQLWAIYLVMNGVERLLIEQIRINIPYKLLGLQVTQGELFAGLFILTGIILFFCIPRYKKHFKYPLVTTMKGAS